MTGLDYLIAVSAFQTEAECANWMNSVSTLGKDKWHKHFLGGPGCKNCLLSEHSTQSAREELQRSWIEHLRKQKAGGGQADVDDAADDKDTGLGCYLPDDALDNLDAEGKFLPAEDAPPSPMDLEDL